MGMLNFIVLRSGKVKLIRKEDLQENLPKYFHSAFSKGRKSHLYAIFWSDHENAHISTLFSQSLFIQQMDEASGEELTVFYAEPGNSTLQFERSTGYQEMVKVAANQANGDESLWPALKKYLKTGEEEGEEEADFFPCISLFQISENGEAHEISEQYFFPLFRDNEINFGDFKAKVISFLKNAREIRVELEKADGQAGLGMEILKDGGRGAWSMLKGFVKRVIRKQVESPLLEGMEDVIGML